MLWAMKLSRHDIQCVHWRPIRKEKDINHSGAFMLTSPLMQEVVGQE